MKTIMWTLCVHLLRSAFWQPPDLLLLITDFDPLTQRIRQRRNQRNSRARKQAYLEDLERRWSNCVKSGAQATAEMQQAARRVDSENGVLRDLLREVGVPDAVVEARLMAAGVARLRNEATASRPRVSAKRHTQYCGLHACCSILIIVLAMRDVHHSCTFS